MAFTYDAEPASIARSRSNGEGMSAGGGWQAAKRGLVRLRGPSPRKELPDWTRQLATLLQAGTNTPEALESLRPDIQSPELRSAVEAMEIATKRGLPLHAAMRRHPRIFGRAYTEIVAAGEQAGTLERMLDPLAKGLINSEKLRNQVSHAMIQPMTSLAAALIGGWYMVQKVVPTFAGLYAREGVELPVVTRALIALADVAGRVGEGGLLLAGITLFLLPTLFAAPAIRRVTDRLALRLPIMGPLTRLNSVSTFMRFFSILLSTESIQEAEAIELAAHTAPNSAVAARLATAARDVAAGTRKLSSALEGTGVVPGIYLQILRTGESTGQVATLATYAADRLEERVLDQAKKAEAAAAPLATGVVIVIVGVMLVGLYGPMSGLYKVLLG